MNSRRIQDAPLRSCVSGTETEIGPIILSVHITMKDLRREREFDGKCIECDKASTGRSTRQDHAAGRSVAARNESEWSGDRHSCPREAGQMGCQRKNVIKLVFRGEGSCEDHPSAVVDQHVESRDQDGRAGQGAEEQRVEGPANQGDEFVRDGQGGLG